MENQLTLALDLMHSGMTVSLGGGHHMQLLAEAIKKDNLSDIRICSPSERSLSYCRKLGLDVIESPEALDIAFDGCDSLDQNLNLLKSNGGIHTLEKVNAQAAGAYVILTDESKIGQQLDPSVPLAVEVIDEAIPQFLRLAKELGLQPCRRISTSYMGYIRTRNGNQLVDCYTDNWAQIDYIDRTVSLVNGVVGTSYFKGLASTVLAETENGSVRTLRKDE